MSVPLDVDERRAVRWKARNATIDALSELGGEAKRSAITDRARALGGFTLRELCASLPEEAARSYSNPVDHALSWAFTNLRKDGLVENPQRGIWRLTKVAAAPEERAAEDTIAELRLAELRAMAYAEYLQTPEWRRTRAAALVRARHRCALDAAHRTGLEVHHNTYERLGAELASDLAVLCHACHRLHHQANGRPRRDPDPAPSPSPPEGASPRRGGSIAPPGYVEPHHRSRDSEPSPSPPSPRHASWLRRVLTR